jgi:hypothetical protein
VSLPEEELNDITTTATIFSLGERGTRCFRMSSGLEFVADLRGGSVNPTSTDVARAVAVRKVVVSVKWVTYEASRAKISGLLSRLENYCFELLSSGDGSSDVTTLRR